MTERKVILRRAPPKAVVERFLEGLNGEPTVVYDSQRKEFTGTNGETLCPICGEAMVVQGLMTICAKDRVMMPK